MYVTALFTMANTFGNPAENARCELLLKAATPDLYRHNAFRVLGVPVTAKLGDIRRRQSRLRIMAKLGGAPSKESGGYLPLDPPPGEEDIRTAMHRLQDMEAWLIDEFFWFWPRRLGTGEDDGLKLLAQNRVNDALSLWLEYERNSSIGKASTHNLAVLYHVVALDLEHKALTKSLSGKELETRRVCWFRAYRRWKGLLDDVGFWNRLTSRMVELNDPRLTGETARRIWRSLPEALLMINGRIAVREAERGNRDWTSRHVKMMRESGLDPRLVDKVLRECLSRVRQGIKVVCEPAEEKAKANPGEADEVARTLLQDTSSLIRTVDFVLPEGDAFRDVLHDEIADAALECVIAYGNHAQDWQGCAKILGRIRDLAAGDLRRRRITENLDMVRDLAQQEGRQEELKQGLTDNRVYDVSVSGDGARVPNACVCCLGPAETEQEVSYSWEETRGTTRYNRSQSFKFPLCANCERHQKELIQQRSALIALAVLGLAIAAFFMGIVLWSVGYVAFIGIGLGASFALLAGLSCLVRVRDLGPDHANRGKSAAIVQVFSPLLPDGSVPSTATRSLRTSSVAKLLEGYTVFRFWNPLYADAFAKANESEAKTKKVMKYSGGRSLIRGRSGMQTVAWTLGIAFLAYSLAYKIVSSTKATPSSAGTRRRTSSRNEERPASPDSVRPSVGVPIREPYRPAYDYNRLRLKSHIDAGKKQLRDMDSELNQLKSQLESLSSRIEKCKTTIRGYESRIELGLSVDRDAYSQDVTNHNALVAHGKGVLADWRSKVAAYEAQVERVNDMVRRYNAGAR